MVSRLLTAFVFLLAISGSAVAAPIEAYSRLPAITDVDISADGQTVAYIASENRRLRVVVQQLDGQILQALELGAVKVRDIAWAGADHILVVTTTTAAIPHATFVGELAQGVSLNIRTGEAVQLMTRVRGASPYLSVLAGDPVYGVWNGEPVVFVEGIQFDPNSTQPGRIDAVRISLADGSIRQHQMGNRYVQDFELRADGAVLANESYDQETGDWTLSVRDGNSWRVVRRENAPIESPAIIGLTQDGQSLLVDFWDDANGIYRPTPVALQTGEIGEPILPPMAVGEILDSQHRMVGYVQNDVFLRYKFFDPAWDATWATLLAALPNRQITLASFTPDFTRLIVYVEGTGFPGNYLMFDAVASRLTQIGRAYPQIAAEEIAEVRSITYHASDGLEIQAYLTLPPGRSATGLPLVVLPHGGPQARDYAGFDWMAQSLASRGYAVLQPNFRGSSGFGQAFVEAAYGEWGRKMQTDLSDGIADLAQRGMVDPSRVCIMGASYGGYAALAGVTVQSGVYRCAVAVAPVTDVGDFLRWRITRSGRESAAYRYWSRYLGIQNPSDEALRAVSPVALASNGDAPVLLIHGRDDTVVPFAQSTAMEHALRSARRSVELVPLREEDHWLSSEATRVQTMAAAVAFIERHNPPT